MQNTIVGTVPQADAGAGIYDAIRQIRTPSHQPSEGPLHEHSSTLLAKRYELDLPLFFVPTHVRGFSTSAVVYKGVQNV